MTVYTDQHLWLRLENNDGDATLGISEFAQESFGELVFVDLSLQEGKSCKSGELLAVVESSKIASDIYVPVDCVIQEKNPLLASQPTLANTSPLEQGWFVKVKLQNKDDVQKFMDEKSYKEYVRIA